MKNYNWMKWNNPIGCALIIKLKLVGRSLSNNFGTKQIVSFSKSSSKNYFEKFGRKLKLSMTYLLVIQLKYQPSVNFSMEASRRFVKKAFKNCSTLQTICSANNVTKLFNPQLRFIFNFFIISEKICWQRRTRSA